MLILTRPAVKTSFNRSLVVDWWSIAGQLKWLNGSNKSQAYINARAPVL